MTQKPHDPALMDSLCRRIHAGETKTDIEIETKISRTTLNKYYKRWLANQNPAAPRTMSELRQKYVAEKPLEKSPRILFADTECLPNKGYFFRTWTKQNVPIPTDFIRKHYSLCSIAWKWLGNPTTTVITNADFPEFDKDPYDDKGILSAFLPEWEKADYIVMHNGKRFDKRVIATRLQINGMQSLPPATIVDTLQLARTHFDLNSNKLDYIAKLLEVGEKISTSASLWVRCAEGDREAMMEMAQYNARDVDVLEWCFVRMLPHIKTPINHNVLADSPVALCKQCGSENIVQRGMEIMQTSIRHRWFCNDCGSWSVFPAKKK